MQRLVAIQLTFNPWILRELYCSCKDSTQTIVEAVIILHNIGKTGLSIGETKGHKSLTIELASRGRILNRYPQHGHHK
jgi:hypothetical protein